MSKLLTINNFFLLVILCMPLYLIRVNIFGLPSNVFEILALLAIAVWIIKERTGCLKRLREIPKLLLFSISLLLAGVLLSILFNDNYRAGFGILKSWFLIPLIFSYALYTELESEKFAEKIFLTIFLSSAAVGFIAIVYKMLNKVTFDDRLTAFYLSPNHLAMYLAPGIFFGCYFITKEFLEKKYLKQFFVSMLLFVAIVIPLYFTYSYGTWLAVLISLFAILFILNPNKKLLLTSIFIIIIAVIFLLQANTQKFSALAQLSEKSSSASRLMIWKSSFLMIQQHPFLGIGPGNFQTKYLENQKHFPPYLEWAVPQPHNIFLAFWIQAGILGLLGFLWLLFFVFRSLHAVFRDKKNAALAAPLLGFFLYTLLHGLIDTPYWKNDLAFLFWICVFLALYLRRKN